MIDSRFSNTDTVPFPSVYGAQQMPVSHHHHRRHHRGHRKNKSQTDLAPLRREDSIPQNEHGHHHHLHHDDEAPIGSGFGVPYDAAGSPQQVEYPDQPQGHSAGENPVQTIKHHRRHRHNRHHTVEAANVGAGGYQYARGAPEQLIGQRSSSALSDREQTRSPVLAPSEGDLSGRHARRRHRRHHRHHHHHQYGGESASFGHLGQGFYGGGPVGADGYGHINEELIFIERGEQSPHRQDAPAGYEYKGRIEVQSVTREYRSGSRGQQVPTYVPLPPPAPAPAPSGFPCPQGWQQAYLTPGGCGPCPSGGTQYIGELVGTSSSIGGYGNYGSGGSYGSYGAGGSTGAYGSYGAPGSTAGYNSYGTSSGYSSYGGGYSGQSNTQVLDYCSGAGYQTQVEERKCPKVIEVWQRRSKTETRSRSPGFDFERFRREILDAIQRIIVPRGPAEVHWPTREPIQTERKESEVRVIVQPIQPVFYMPRQSETPRPTTTTVVQQPSAPNVVYVPRNVYVPVVKPVFVPRERVIVRPQVVHVARPVLVDRPVPVTQRPIIIDRERPVPVPVHQERQQGGTRIVKEEFVYRDNVPKAYGARCAEYTGGVKYGYVAKAPIPSFGKTEVLDTTINPNWQRTDETSLVSHYGRPAGDIVHRSKAVEQQIISELRHSGSGANIVRSASFGTGFGVRGVGCESAQF